MDLQKTFKKSLWKNPATNKWTYFCPLCKSERALPHGPNPSTPRAFAQVGITTAFFILVTFHWFGWKGAVAFVPFWLIYETLFRTRVRAKLHCDQCGFDPFLAIQDVKRAKAEVETHWRKKFEEKGLPWPQKGARTAAGQAPNAPSFTDADEGATGPGSQTTQ